MLRQEESHHGLLLTDIRRQPLVKLVGRATHTSEQSNLFSDMGEAPSWRPQNLLQLELHQNHFLPVGIKIAPS